MGWKKIEDDKILHVWKNPETGKECEVPPDFYQESGTPICPESGEDYIYSHTLIKTEGSGE
jgi:hypothetical protein